MPTISVHVDDAIYQQVRALADQLDRSQSWVVGDALQPYLDHHRWMIEETPRTLAEVQSGNATRRVISLAMSGATIAVSTCRKISTDSPASP